MAWTTLADALKSAIAQGQIAAETGVGAPDPAILAKSKRTPTEAGAKFTGQRRVEGDDISDTASSGVEVRPALPSGRWERTAVPDRDAPSLAVRCHLRLVMGGRTTGEEAAVRPMLKPYRGDGRAILRLVSG